MKYFHNLGHNLHLHRTVGNQFNYPINCQRKISQKKEEETLNLTKPLQNKNLKFKIDLIY